MSPGVIPPGNIVGEPTLSALEPICGAYGPTDDDDGGAGARKHGGLGLGGACSNFSAFFLSWPQTPKGSVVNLCRKLHFVAAAAAASASCS